MNWRKRIFFCIVWVLTQTMLCFSYKLSAQTIQDQDFLQNFKFRKNNYVVPLSSIKLKYLNDTTLDLSFYESDSNTNKVERKIHYLLNENLGVQDTIEVWKRGNNFVPFTKTSPPLTAEYGIATDILINEKNGQKLRYYLQPINDSLANISLYTIKNKVEKDSLLFSKDYNNRADILPPYVYDTTIIVFSNASTNYYVDTAYIELYGISSGQLLNQRKMHNFQNTFSEFVINYTYHPPQQFLNSDSLVCLVQFANIVAIINRHDLTTKQIFMPNNVDFDLMINYEYFYIHVNDYQMDSIGYRFVSTVVHNFNKVHIEDQFGMFEIGWSDTLLNSRTFGDTLIDQSVSAGSFGDSTTYIVGNSPRPQGSSFRAIEKLLLFKINDKSVDSIYLYGFLNHVAVDVVSNTKGDVFIASVYHDDWVDSLLHVLVTKIPASLLTSISEQNISRSVHIYPNPATEVLNSEEFKFGENFKIYSINGQLLKEETITQEKQIEVGNLPNGTYLLQLLNSEKPKTVVFIKN